MRKKKNQKATRESTNKSSPGQKIANQSLASWKIKIASKNRARDYKCTIGTKCSPKGFPKRKSERLLSVSPKANSIRQAQRTNPQVPQRTFQKMVSHTHSAPRGRARAAPRRAAHEHARPFQTLPTGSNIASQAHTASLARTNETKRFPGFSCSQPPMYKISNR